MATRPLLPSTTREYSVNDIQNYGAIDEVEEEVLEPAGPCWLGRIASRLCGCGSPCSFSGDSKGKSHDQHVLSNEYESLDYEEIHNKIFIEEETDKGSRFVMKRSVFRWIVMMFIGGLTAGVAVFIDIMIDQLSRLKHKAIQMTYRKFTEEDPFPLPLFAWVGVNCGFVMIAAILVAYFAPVAAGSGIPQIKCYLNGVKVPKVVRIKTLICKVVGVIFAVVGGLAVGKEGPMIHSGAVIAAGISQGRTTTYKKDFKIFEYFRDDHEKRDFVSGGAAAGVSAAFGAPVGGVLFSLEEGASFWNQGLTWRIFFSSMVSYFTLNTLLSWYHGHTGQLQYSGLLNFGSFDNLSYQYWEIPLIFIPMGIVGGLLGALFVIINVKLSKFRNENITRPLTCVVEAMLVAAVSASVFFLFIYLQDDCQSFDVQRTEVPIQAFCNDGEVSTVATLLLQTPEKSVRSLFHDPPDTYKLGTLAIFFIIYFGLSVWTYGLSVPAGLFIPALLCGAAWGRMYGDVIWIVIPKIVCVTGDCLNPGKYALIGAAAQLGGIVRMTISLTVILMEATGNVSFGLPIMIVLMVAKWVGDVFTEGIYDEHIALAKVPLLGWEAPPITSGRRAVEVMSTPVTVFRSVEKVAVILKYLKKYKHNGFPIVSNYDPDMVDAVGMENDEHENEPGQKPKKKLKRFGRLIGFITRYQIIVLLKRQHFTHSRHVIENSFLDITVGHLRRHGTSSTRNLSSHNLTSAGSLQSLHQTHSLGDVDPLPRLTTADFRDAYPRYPDIETIHIPESDMDALIDLRPYMNDSPYHMNYRATLPRLFSLFRALGLRHVTVTDNYNYVVGIVTRIDIARFREVWSCGSDETHEVLPISKRPL